MYLRETMSHAEQLAYMVTIAHDAWINEELAGVAEGNFDSWMSFIGQLAVQISSVDPRTEQCQS